MKITGKENGDFNIVYEDCGFKDEEEKQNLIEKLLSDPHITVTKLDKKVQK